MDIGDRILSRDADRDWVKDAGSFMTDDDVNVGWVGCQHRAAEDLELVVRSEQKSFTREQRYLLN